MPIRAFTPGEGVTPVQIRAQLLRRPHASERADARSAFPSMAEEPPTASRKGAWRQAEVRRAINAAEKAGLTSYRVEIAPDGTIAIVVGDPAATAPPAQD